MRIVRWKYFYLIFYAVISLAILGPLLLPGSVFTLDMRLGPNVDLNTHLYGTSQMVESAIRTPIYPPLWLVSQIAPFWLWQKIIFFLIFFLAGVGAHRLFPFKGAASYFAGLLYMINPFTYVRFLAGQDVILEVYALIPFAVKAFVDLLRERGKRNAIKVAILTTLVGVMYAQGFYLVFLTFFIILVVWMITQRNKNITLNTVKYIGISAALFLVVNLYWLIPFLTAHGGGIIEQIGQQDLFSFAPKPTSDFGIMIDVASMYGFWRGGYIYTKDILPFWWLLMLFLLFLGVYGFVSRVGDKKHWWLVLSFGLIWLAGLLLAVGAASDLTRPLFEWPWKYFPFFRAFRDSHKFVALLCLSYAYLGALGVNELIDGLKQQGKRLARIGMTVLVAVAMLAPLGYSFAMFGFHGQLGVTDYPKEWYEVNEYLNKDKDDFFVLFLPWHEFMDYSWLPNQDKRWGASALAFFDKPVIQGDNIEMPGVYTQSPNPISNYVSFLLEKRSEINNLGELLAPLNVKYVILVHEVDYETYDVLHHQEDLAVELEKPGITLFRNEHPTARVYSADSVVYIENLEEYLALSKEQDVMEHLYIIGEGMSDSNNSGMEKLDFVEKSPVKYQIEGTTHKYTVFTLPQNVTTNHWEYNSQKPLKNLMFMPSFESSPDGGEVTYARFYHIYLPSYIISGVALISVILWFCLPVSSIRAILRKKTT